jgi:hypothetical protein
MTLSFYDPVTLMYSSFQAGTLLSCSYHNPVSFLAACQKPIHALIILQPYSCHIPVIPVTMLLSRCSCPAPVTMLLSQCSCHDTPVMLLSRCSSHDASVTMSLSYSCHDALSCSCHDGQVRMNSHALLTMPCHDAPVTMPLSR